MALYSSSLSAEDYVNIQVMHYSETEEEATVVAPSIELNMGIGGGYTLNANLLTDIVSGASPTYYDKTYDSVTKASPYSHGTHSPSAYERGSHLSQEDVGHGKVDYRDLRYIGGVNITKDLEDKDQASLGFSFSNEHEFRIPEVSASYLHYLDKYQNRSLEVSASYQYAQLNVWCINNTHCDTKSGGSKNFYQKIFDTQVTYAQNIDKNTIGKISLFGNFESGELSNPYMNVVRDYNTNPIILNENRPDSRNGYGVKLSLAKALREDVVLHGNYRYYRDSWDISAHTIESKLFYEYSDKLTFDGSLRYHSQSKADFYSGKKDYFTDEKYASSDWRIGDVQSASISLGVTHKLSKKLSQNLMFALYDKEYGKTAMLMIAGQKYKF